MAYSDKSLLELRGILLWFCGAYILSMEFRPGNPFGPFYHSHDILLALQMALSVSC